MDSSTLSEADSSPAEPLPPQGSRRKRVLGMTPGQLVTVAALVIILLILIAVFAYLVLTSFPLLP